MRGGDRANRRRVRASCRRHPHVRGAQRLFGEPDYLRRNITADLPAFQELYDERLATLPACNASAPPSS